MNAHRPGRRSGSSGTVIVPAFKPVVSIYTRPTRFVLEEPFAVRVNGNTLHIPEGFCFDFASVPRLLWPLCGPHELGNGPLIHDWLYKHAGQPPGTTPPATFTRRQADRYLLLICRHEQIPRWRRWPAWAAVRAFGFFAWRNPCSPS